MRHMLSVDRGGGQGSEGEKVGERDDPKMTKSMTKCDRRENNPLKCNFSISESHHSRHSGHNLFYGRYRVFKLEFFQYYDPPPPPSST